MCVLHSTTTSRRSLARRRWELSGKLVIGGMRETLLMIWSRSALSSFRRSWRSQEKSSSPCFA